MTSPLSPTPVFRDFRDAVDSMDLTAYQEMPEMTPGNASYDPQYETKQRKRGLDDL